MRLIDADQFKEYITLDDDDLGVFKTEKQKQVTISIMEAIKKDIDEQPTIDAVEVVRCKNCKHWNTKLTKVFMCYCPMEDRWTGDDYYCASGERKDDE